MSETQSSNQFAQLKNRLENGGTLTLTPISGKDPDSFPGFDAGKSGLTVPDPAACRRRFAGLLREAGLDPVRFIDVHDGEKRSTDHTQLGPEDPRLDGNYGVYGGPGAGEDGAGVLVDVDIDDYKDSAADDAVDAVLSLPETLAVESPHTDGETGGHRFYAVPDEVLDRLEDRFGKKNLGTSWGEVRVENQYVVGPGSQLDGCNKGWCDDCADPDGGYYLFAHDRPIAHVDVDTFIEAVRPGVDGHDAQTDAALDEFGGVEESLTKQIGDDRVGMFGKAAGSDEDLVEFDDDPDIDTVADALGAINPDVGRDVWLALGFAVHAAAPSSRGQRLFEKWSQKGQKWDNAAAYDVEWIWGNATPGAKITVGTLFHYAQQAGWEPDGGLRGGPEPTAALPLAHLDALTASERERFARKRGHDWPATGEARDRLRDAIFREMRAGNTTVLNAPTALGKSHAVATEPWLARADVTGEAPVIQFHPTQDARDEATTTTAEAGADGAVLKGRKERCPVARGDHDPVEDDGGGAPGVIVTVDGEPASEWLDRMCDDKGLPFSTAHAVARERNDQELDELPCCECPAKTQWQGIPWEDQTHRCEAHEHTVADCPDCYTERVRCGAAEHNVGRCPECRTERLRCDDAGSEGHSVDECPDCNEKQMRCRLHDPGHHVSDCPDCENRPVRCDLHDPDHTPAECHECRDGSRPAVDVVHATNQFAYVPSLRTNTNVILDEQPDFTVELEQDRIRRMVNAYLQEISAPVSTWEAFVQLARFEYDGSRSDVGAEQDALDDALGARPDREWFVDERDAHALAPDLTRAIWKALRREDPDVNGRRSKKVLHQPPRFDTGGGDGYGGTWLSVVIDEENTVRQVRNTPDFSQARSVIGLDAHPSMPMWKLNAAPGMVRDAVLDPEERRLWRRYERGLTVVQVGDATRPRSGEKAREWMNDERVRVVLDRLRDHYGSEFETAIAPQQVEGGLRRLLEDVAGEHVDGENTMHYGEEKSRNDFSGESVGYLYGCMDPGDGMILDALAELDLDAEPATVTTEEGEVKREKGRTFDGADADTAAALLAGVRENHVAQSAGRYARTPDDPESDAVVYAHTDALPPGFADLQVPGVEWLATDLQREIIDELTWRPSATLREIADAVGCSKEHVRKTLGRLEEQDVVVRVEGAGEHGADVYSGEGGGGGLVDLALGEPGNGGLCGTSRWSVAVCVPDAHGPGDQRAPHAPGATEERSNQGDPAPLEPG